MALGCAMVMASQRGSPLCSAGDEGPAALAIVQASPVDCGVYRCTIRNEHGSASTDFCLSPEGECELCPPSPGSLPGPHWGWGGEQSSLQRWSCLWADLPEDSGFLFSFSTQCCQDSSPEKKVKVGAPQGEEWVGLCPYPAIYRGFFKDLESVLNAMFISTYSHPLPPSLGYGLWRRMGEDSCFRR